jgi:hypothetical protein
MKGLAVLLALLCTLALTSCTTTQGEPDSVAMYPPQAAPKNMSQAEASGMCRPGFYFCPGRVNGCCPNGWGCASTRCVRPAGQPVDRVDREVDKQAVDKQGRQAVERRCSPGTYFCPGRVNGCCPNGWGCASTHCVRPGGAQDM